TRTAPPMTKAREGSQVPARSRKFNTFAGSDMPETTRPTPNRRPSARLMRNDMGSGSDNVADEEDSDDGRRHKDAGGDEGAGRQSRESADTVTRRAAIAPDRPEADEEARSEH